MSEIAASDELMEVVFAALDHGIDSVREGGPLIPFVLEESEEGRSLSRFAAERLEKGVEQARAHAGASGSDRVAVAWDGYLTVADAARLEQRQPRGAEHVRFPQPVRELEQEIDVGVRDHGFILRRVTTLALYEDLLSPGERLELAAGGRMVYVASGEIAGLHAGSAAFGSDESTLAAGNDGATVLRWELTEWSVDDAKLAAHVELDPWADYAMRCERDGGRAAGPGIGCVLRGELSVDGETVQPFGAFVEPADVAGSGSFVRVVLVLAEDSNGDALAQGAVHL